MDVVLSGRGCSRIAMKTQFLGWGKVRKYEEGEA